MKIKNKGTKFNFYILARKLNISAEDLYSLYQKLFPSVKIYSYKDILLEKEVEQLVKYKEKLITKGII